MPRAAAGAGEAGSGRPAGQPDRVPGSFAGAGPDRFRPHLKPGPGQALRETAAREPGPDSQHATPPQGAAYGPESRPRVQPGVVFTRRSFRPVVRIEQDAVKNVPARPENVSDVARTDAHPRILQRG